MKQLVRYGSILGLICVIAGTLLAIVNSLTAPKILAQAQEQEQRVLSEIIPQALRFEPVKSDAGEILYYDTYDGNNKNSGIVFKASKKGYASVIETMVGMSRDGKILSIRVLSQNETPGLGSRVAEDAFTGQFSNKKLADLSNVEAITGATISSTAVIDSVRKKAEQIKGLIKNGK